MQQLNGLPRRRSGCRAALACRGVLACVALALACLPARALEPGAPVPALVAAPLVAGGASVSLPALRGKVVYVDFWASWCVPCRISMPALDQLFLRLEDKGFTVVGVNKDMNPDDALRFLRRAKVRFPLVGDAGDAWARAFEVKAMPSGYLVDRRGVIRRVHRGFTENTARELEAEIAELLQESP